MLSSSTALIFVHQATYERTRNLLANISIQLELIDTSMVISRATMMATMRLLDDDLNQLSNVSVNGTSTAFLNCTSGSTGKPKIVEHTHSSLIYKLRALNEGYIFRSSDNILQMSNCQWVSHIWNISVSFWLGSTLVLLHPDGNLDVAYIVQTMERKQISAIASLPSTARLLGERVLTNSHEHLSCFDYLRAYTLGGKLQSSFIF